MIKKYSTLPMVREYDDVVAEAKKNKKEVHMARVHGICVEKNYQLSEDNPGRKFKGKRRSTRKSGEESALGGSILPRLGKFPCFLRSLTMGRFLRMSSWALRQAGRCDSGIHPGQVEGTFVLGGVYPLMHGLLRYSTGSFVALS